MIGQKILTSFDDDNALDRVVITAAPAGLTLRRIQSKTLRIMTDAIDSVSDDRTHRLGSDICRRTSQLLTPDTSHTFGYPNPTTGSKFNKDDIELCAGRNVAVARPSLVELSERRLLRYTRAQQALQTAFRHCRVEPSPEDLKVRALRRVTTLLSTEARGAQENAARLRTVLADREAVEPQEYRSTQRACWMEQRRSADRNKQSKAVQQSLVAITDPQTNAAKPPTDSRSIARHQSRRRTNLARFHERSQTCVQFPSRPLSSAYHAASCRRQTISRVRSMRLRSLSLSQRVKPPISQTKVRDPPGNLKLSHSSEVRFGSSGPVVRPILSSPATIHVFPSLEDSPDSFDCQPGVGVARIYASSSARRPRDEIMADMGEVVLPRYALDLLDELAATPTEVSLKPLLSVRPSRASLPSPTSYSVDDLAHMRNRPAAENGSKALPARQAFVKNVLVDGPGLSKYHPSASVSSVPDSFIVMSRPSADLLGDTEQKARARPPRAGADASANGHHRFSIVSMKAPGGVMSKMKSRLAALGHRR